MSLFRVVVLLAALALVLSGCGGLSEAEQHTDAGMELYDQGD